MEDIQRGDLVEIVWKDHFRYKGRRPKEYKVKSWGMVEDFNQDGIGIVQNLVPDHEKLKTSRVADGQFILFNAIVGKIKILAANR